MTSTLKEKYEIRKVKNLRERLHHIDKVNNLREIKYGPRDLLLLEALDPKQSAIAFDIIKKLNATDFTPIKAFNDVKKAVIDDVKKVLGGGGKDPIRAISNFFKKLTSKGEQLNDDPLSTAMAFVDSTRNFFEDMSKVIDAMNLPTDKTIRDGITGKSDNDFSDEEKSLAKIPIDKEAQKQIKLMSNVIQKSLRPDFDASKLGQGWIRKYLPGLTGGKGVKMIVDGVLNMKPSDLKSMAELISKNFANAAAEGNKIAAEAGKGSNTSGSEQSKSTTNSEPSSNSKSTEPTKSGSVKGTENTKSSKLKDDHVKYMSKEFAKRAGVDVNAAYKLLKTLNDNEKLKESIFRALR